MPRYRGSRKEIQALSAFVKLLRAAETVSTEVHGYLSGMNLTVSQFGVLEALYHLGPMCQRDIARKILKSSGNITLVLDNLEKRGLVERKRDREDRRYYTVFLTAAGEQLIGDIFPAHAARIVRVMGALSSTEQKEFARLCRKLAASG